MNLKTLCTFYMLSFIYCVIIGQPNMQKCKINYVLETLNDTNKQLQNGYDLMISDTDQNTLFDWPDIIGPVIIKKINKESFEINCLSSTLKISKNKVVYKRTSFCKVIFNINNCNIEKRITFKKKVDTLSLVKKYGNLKIKYSKTYTDSVSNKVKNILLKYSCDLMYGALLGSDKCRQLYFAYIIDFPFMQFGLNGSDYISNREIIKRLTK